MVSTEESWVLAVLPPTMHISHETWIAAIKTAPCIHSEIKLLENTYPGKYPAKQFLQMKMQTIFLFLGRYQDYLSIWQILQCSNTADARQRTIPSAQQWNNYRDYTWEPLYTEGCCNSVVSIISKWQEGTIFQCYKPIIKEKRIILGGKAFSMQHWLNASFLFLSALLPFQQKQILSDRKVHFPLCPAAHSLTVQSMAKSEMGKKKPTKTQQCSEWWMPYKNICPCMASSFREKK